MNKLVAQTLAKKENGEKGFTLIELLVVVIIIGILAAIAIPVFLNMREGAWRSSVESDVAGAALALEQAATANNGSLAGVTVPTDATAATPITAGTDTLATLTVTEGNTIGIVVGADQSYTITGENENVTTGDTTYTYSSATGTGTWG